MCNDFIRLYPFAGYEHDDRAPLPQNTSRRVSFKNQGHGNKHKNNRQRGWDDKLRVLMDDDVEMSVNVRGNDRL